MIAGCQVCWEKFARYAEVEERFAPLSEDCFVLTPERALALIDENTIGASGRGLGLLSRALWHFNVGAVCGCVSLVGRSKQGNQRVLGFWLDCGSVCLPERASLRRRRVRHLGIYGAHPKAALHARCQSNSMLETVKLAVREVAPPPTDCVLDHVVALP
jgi:hypothetical protein